MKAVAPFVRAARRRAWLDGLALVAPLAAGAAAVAWRAFGPLGLGAGLCVGMIGALLVWRRMHALDSRRIAARLNALAPELEDSAELLLADGAALEGLAALQRRRLEARLGQGLSADPRPRWSVRGIITAWGVLALALLLLALPAPPAASDAPAARTPLASPLAVQLLRLRIYPPAYTGLPQRIENAPDVALPEGARVAWRVRFSRPPAHASLVFSDGARLALRQDGEGWAAAREVAAPVLYRLEAPGLARQPWRRLDVVRDAPPRVAVLAPSEQFSTAAEGQTRWTPVFEASDDYGVQARAVLRITLTSGEGEQITATRRERPLQGVGGGARKRWSAPLDLASLGLAPGGDLIVQVIVRDNRSPNPQVVEGPSVILTLPTAEALAEGLDGLLVPTQPAFFRSQRQIILDAEALVRERPRLPRETFIKRANALGADQAALRLRYGQFLGEEAEGVPLPTADAPPLPTADAPSAPAPQHFAGDGHDHGADAPLEGQNDDPVQDAARRFGHVHDEGDAATLFDPGARATLSRALDAMWGSERELRQARPEQALPFARAALEALKQAQQASRIYLRKTGSNFPPLDFARRLGGKRSGIEPAPPGTAAPTPPAREVLEAWNALEQRPDAPPLQLAALEAWAVANRAALADPLALLAAIDAVRLDPACAPCRQSLRAALWPALQAQPSAQRREGGDAAGRRYLEALP